MKNSILNTDQLIKRCKQNDYQAQMFVYNSYKNMMYGVAYRILNNRENAEDLIQDAFIVGFQKIHQIQDEANLGGWLKRIVTNKSLDKLRMDKRIQMVDQELAIENTTEEEAQIDPRIPVEVVKKAINELKEKYRIVLTLYLIEDYNHREIGEMLQIKESTVRNQYKRGKQQLLELIKTSRL
ncbi:MAG: RNA polymerase subunit sigma-70 [Flavobacteriaceae bacterium]|nr:RNA polymerase subunit sigma-70 [Flavobacteriaceae bacterium]